MSEKPTVDRCEWCSEPPSGSMVRRIGDDGPVVDMGHPYCYGQALDDLKARRRATAVAR